MKLILPLALAALLASCSGFQRSNRPGSVYTGWGQQVDEEPGSGFVQRSRAQYGPLFMAETKPWMVGSVQEQWPNKYALPGSGWKGGEPQTPVIDDYSMGSGGRATAAK
jgi:hypothetical protein